MTKPPFITLSIQDLGSHTRVNIASIVCYYDYKPGHAIIFLMNGQRFPVEDTSSAEIDALIATAFENTH